MDRNDFDYYEYITTYDKKAYLEQLNKIQNPDFGQLVNEQNNSIVLTDRDFPLYLDKLVDINYRDGDGSSLIHYICAYGTASMFIEVANRGANLECADIYGQRPVHHICKRGELDMYWAIMGYEIDIECADIDGRRPIHYVCQYGTLHMIHCIIKKGAYLAPADNDGYRPIHLIAQYGDVNMLNNMIEYMSSRGRVYLDYEVPKVGKLIDIICLRGNVDMLAAVIDRVTLQKDDIERLLKVAEESHGNPEFLARLQLKLKTV